MRKKSLTNYITNFHGKQKHYRKENAHFNPILQKYMVQFMVGFKKNGFNYTSLISNNATGF